MLKLNQTVLTVSRSIAKTKLTKKILPAKVIGYEYDNGKCEPILKRAGKEISPSEVHIFETVEDAVKYLNKKN